MHRPTSLRKTCRQGVTQLQGRVGNAFMVVTENPVSLELKRLANDPSEPPPELGTLAQYATVVSTFEELALRWLSLENCPPLWRLAFGSTLVQPVSSHATAYETLDRYLPDIKIRPDSSDFSYQINGKRTSIAMDGLVVNRLSRWSTVELQQMVFRPEGIVMRQSGMLACQVALDMNSVPSTEPLSKDRLGDLFRELVELATEVLCKGDIP